MSKIKIETAENEKSVICIHSIKDKGILTAYEYNYLLRSLGKPLKLMGIFFHRSGKFAHLSLHTARGCITLFPDNDFEATIYLSQNPTPVDF